jgi:transposase-like protein
VIKSDPFKWRHHQSEIILLCVRRYLRYALSYRDLEEMMRSHLINGRAKLKLWHDEKN